MATRRQPVTQLRELIQENQEPFILELYLMGKGYLRKRFNLITSFSCSHGNSRKPLKRAVSCDLKPQCSKVLRAVCDRIISLNKRLGIKRRNPRDGNVDVAENKNRNNQEIIIELDRFSSASSSTVFDSRDVSDAEETSASERKEKISIEVKEAVTDRKQCQEERRQLNPVSVLEAVASHRDDTRILSRIKAKNGSKTRAPFQNKVTEDSILSASLWKVLVQSATEKPTLPGVSEIQELVQSNPSSRYFKSKTVLQQTKQLLFACVKEIVQTQERKKQSSYLESEEYGRLIGEKIKCWGRQGGEESNLAQLLELDLWDSSQEWISHQSHRRRIEFEIGDAILEEIRIEIVMNLIDFSSITKC